MKGTVKIPKVFYYLLILSMVVSLIINVHRLTQGQPEIHIHYMNDNE